jgi:2-polyprenyl-6-methoxyphenol hydroxylase-like FAD-dependent oxidoreductase
MKIVIIGGGVGGVATYLALEKHLSDISPTIKVYEAYPDPASTTSIIGGGLGLAPNGLRAISSFCPEATKTIEAQGFHGSVMTLRNSHGKLLGRLQSGKKDHYGFDQMFLARAAVHEALLEELPQGAVGWGKKVTSLKETEEGVDLNFEDGSVEHADLVIGADGVRSRVREGILGRGYEAEYQ